MTASWRMGIGTIVIVLTGALLAAPPAGASTRTDALTSPGEGAHAPEPNALAESDSPVVVPNEPSAVGNVAHRGASMTAPENTMAAIRQAIAQDANFVGIDVRRTQDNEIVVLHDATLRRTTNVETVFPGRKPWPVDGFTLAEIKRLDAGSWVSPVYSGERVPTLAEMLTELAPSGTGVFLEIKNPDLYGGLSGIGAPVVDAIRLHTDWLAPDRPERRLVVQTFKQHEEFLRELTDAYPDVPIGLLGDVGGQLDGYTWAGQVNVHHTDVSSELVTEAHALGLAVSTYVVNDAVQMGQVVDAGIDAISTDYPAKLRDILRERGRELVDPSAGPPPEQPPAAIWSLTMPSKAQVLGLRVPVDARLQTVYGTPARWAWVRVEHQTRQGWRSLQRPRVTDGNGELHTTVAARAGLQIRMRSLPSQWHLETVSDAHDVATRPATTRGVLTGARQLVDERSTLLRVRWVAEDGRAVTGGADLWARSRGRDWERLRTITVVDGSASSRVRPRVNTRYELRFRAGSWWAADQDRHYVDNVPSGRVVQLPPRAPQPSVRLPAQRRGVGAGLNAAVSRVGQWAWDEMTGRSWHPGCPVGRARLRLLRLNYWGYDGYRHRGEIVVARGAAGRVVRAFAELHRKGYPVRSMHRVSRFRGGWAHSQAAGNTSGFDCAGARRPGPHALGRSVTVNPWENPEVLASGVSPNRWWLPRSRRSAQVHDSRRHPAVEAFASQGFRWANRGQDYGRFRLL